MDKSRARVYAFFESTLLLYPRNWWSLHWSFVWRLRRHEEGLDWPCANKERSGGAHFSMAQRGGWAAHRGPTRANGNNFGGLLRARQDGGWSQVSQDNTARRGPTSGIYSPPPPAAVGVCPSDQLRPSLKPSLDVDLREGVNNRKREPCGKGGQPSAKSCRRVKFRPFRSCGGRKRQTERGRD